MQRRIAVIEDEATIAAAVAARLRAEGLDVEIAWDGIGGVALCQRFRPEFVVLDLMLLGLSALRESPASTWPPSRFFVLGCRALEGCR